MAFESLANRLYCLTTTLFGRLFPLTFIPLLLELRSADNGSNLSTFDWLNIFSTLVRPYITQDFPQIQI